MSNEPGQLPSKGTTPLHGKSASDPEKSDESLKNAVQKISQNKPEVFQEIMMAMGTVGHPLLHKLNDQHVSRVLDLIVQHDQNQFELTKQTNTTGVQESKSIRRYFFLTFLALSSITVFVLIFFKDKPETLHPILTGLGGLVAGGLGGYGIGKRKE